MNEQIDQNPQENKPQITPKVFSWALFAEFGLEAGIMIALPLIIFIFLGQIINLLGFQNAANAINDYSHNNTAYQVLGLLGAISLSAYMVYRKIKAISDLLKK